MKVCGTERRMEGKGTSRSHFPNYYFAVQNVDLRCNSWSWQRNSSFAR